jgi:hypothetical protein
MNNRSKLGESRMNCVELHQSLAEVEDSSSAEQQAHLAGCPACSTLVADLNLIISTAAELREVDEPSPRVWNSIAIALRQERLIRPPGESRSLVASFGERWGRARWMVPAAAALLILVGIYANQHSLSTRLGKDTLPVPAANVAVAGMNDADLLQEVADRAPFMKMQYEDNLRRVNEYILDAQSTVDANPNDAEARRSLMDAYQQKAMLFEMAMDRSLP